MKYLSREDLLEFLGEREEHPELNEHLSSYVDRFVAEKDYQVLEKLFAAGASATSADPTNDYLRLLLHEYEVERTLNGPEIRSIMELLLKNGANPNRVTDNNLRAYDYALSHKTTEIVVLLEKYGADQTPREPI
ncbi:hypothetical protein E5198_21100 [Pseudomonas sp. A-1]|uniref:hypothetical protein n=1 Tax=Pseudomonas sp. A-1 TaxID=1821274 RepID=UPI0010A62959|nr:hypothetical protein [Pseudomonas sp. A-1]THG69835.1 hypothetical protein E5198_21100 [Pseudomonas sp. A-1]